jgi:heptosyltransferase-1
MNKTLVILPNNLGDVIMALPVLEGLKKKDPDTHLTFFVEEGFEAGLVNSLFCDRIFRFNRKAIRDHALNADWRRATVFLKETVQVLADERIDKVINLSQHPYTSYLTTLLACANSVGRHYLRDGNHALGDPWSQYLYAIPFARACNGLHATDVYCRIAGVVSPPSRTVIHLDDDEQSRAQAFLAANGLRPGAEPIMVLQPGAAYGAKRWPLEHFAVLGSKLALDGSRIIVTGAPAEQELALALGARIGNRALVTAGKVTFRETMAFLPFVSGCVTGDTAIMHAAAGLDLKVYALFGPTNPVETGPYGEGHHVFFGRCAKRPCFCMDCKNTFCMKSIGPDLVYSTIKGATVKKAGCDV